MNIRLDVWCRLKRLEVPFVRLIASLFGKTNLPEIVECISASACFTAFWNGKEIEIRLKEVDNDPDTGILHLPGETIAVIVPPERPPLLANPVWRSLDPVFLASVADRIEFSLDPRSEKDVAAIAIMVKTLRTKVQLEQDALRTITRTTCSPQPRSLEVT